MTVQMIRNLNAAGVAVAVVVVALVRIEGRMDTTCLVPKWNHRWTRKTVKMMVAAKLGYEWVSTLKMICSREANLKRELILHESSVHHSLIGIDRRRHSSWVRLVDAMMFVDGHR
jgi:hypothetical protein